MSDVVLPGALTGSAAGIILKELVRRATNMAHRMLFDFTTYEKVVDYKTDAHDVVTSVDLAAQTMYEKSLRECFPGYGVVGEERGLSIPCELDGCDVWMTVDPIDGTKALARRQSHGIATMVSMVYGKEVIASAISDIMTGEVFHHRPGSAKVHRLVPTDQICELTPNNKPLGEQYLLMRENPLDACGDLSRLCFSNKTHDGALFRDIEVMGGSIGCMFARLWKQEVGGIILQMGKTTPWDLMPLIGPTKLLGYDWYSMDHKSNGRATATIWEPPVTQEKVDLPPLLIIPKSGANELLGWL